MKCSNPSCQKETTNPKFCGRTCSAIITNKTNPRRKRKERQCKRCEKLFLTLSWQRICDDCRTLRSISWDKPIGELTYLGKHRSWRGSLIRGLTRNRYRDQATKCLSCGYSRHVEVCHIKPVSSFPDSATLNEVSGPENITFLCPNCHWEFDHPAALSC